MRSSIGATKIFTFYFILLYLFLKAKMCAGSVRASRSISDSDINYYDIDESFLSPPAGVTSAPLDLTPSSVDLESYSAKNHRRRHASIMPKTHHVRHEHHYVKNRHITQAQQALRAYKSSLRAVNSRMDNHVYTSHHRPRGHHSRMHHHSNRNMLGHQNRGKSRLNSPDNSSFMLSRTGGIETTKLSRSNLSSSDSIHQNMVHIDHQAANSFEYFSTPGVATEKSSAKSIINSNNLNNFKKAGSTPYSKTYFEELLNSYKSHSPYYKDHQQKDSSRLIKSLSTAKGKCSGKKCKNEPTGEESEDFYYDYEDEEEDDDEDDDDDVDNVEAQGDAGYSTTASPIFHESEISKSSKASSQNTNNHGNSRQHGSGYGEKQENNKNDASESTAEEKPAKKESHKTDGSRLASFHAAKIRREGSCFIPKPKMILASNDPSKQYTPHCTILHRCGDDVGCCLPTQTCAASKNSTVELYFFVQTVGSRPSIERLSFINHTECACFSRHDSPHWRVPGTSTSSPMLPVPVCTCPSLFQRVIDDENRCICDCSSSDTQCDQFKRGLEHFSMENRRCIKDGRCIEPVCEYGQYNKAKGKCPTREEKLSIAFRGY
ncbi:uncharacterized protein DDB_G0283357-like [Ochlerotatus camptorhynchus]|uniref:uncharacterized protein DDB_G0283357-like n=1 Tax=Ochlerotatus camptorhynchus TaxID=644619 RepID=UPI0031D0B053